MIRKTLVTVLLAALVAPFHSTTPTVHAATSCSTKSDTGWVVVRDIGHIAYFKKAERGVGATEVSDPAVFANSVAVAARSVVDAAGTTVKLKVVAQGGADAAGRLSSNIRIAKSRARYGAKAMKAALAKLGAKSVVFTYEHSVSGDQDDPFDRYFGLTVFRCDPSLIGGGTTPSTSTKCAPPITTLLQTETFLFTPAKRSLRDGLTPADRAVYTSRMVYMANIVKKNLTSPGGVYVEITGYASPAGSTTSNDWLALNRAKTAESSLRRALTTTLQSSTRYVTFKTVGSPERRTDPTAQVTIYYCP